MNSDAQVRKELVFLLNDGNAHMSFEEAIAQYPISYINNYFPNVSYSSWHLLEHIRITQKDILEFITNPKYKEMTWPEEYWPVKDKKATKVDWDKTIRLFLKDRKALSDLVDDTKVDIHAKIPHGTGQTIMREILVVSDHTAYHLGEFTIMRQVMDTWGKNHSS